MPATIDKAMILAAGFGKRMLPLTLKAPKPMIPIAGKAMIDYALERLARASLTTVVVNTHYLSEILINHLTHANQLQIIISDEQEALLDTGGGIKNALTHFGDKPFYLLNCDSLWIEKTSNLERLTACWDDRLMDGMLLLTPTDNAMGYRGSGDFALGANGIIEPASSLGVKLVYTGTALLAPRIFADSPNGAFSLNFLFDRAIAARRLYATTAIGQWLHVSNPLDRIRAEEIITNQTRSRKAKPV